MALNYKKTSLYLSAMMCAWSIPVDAFAANQSHTLPLEIIDVTASRLPRELYNTPAAVTLVDGQREFQLQEALQLDEALQFVPGVYFQNRYNFAQNLRISIRGFGSRAPFGVRGMQLHVDNIPYTLPDGQTQVDDIELNGIDQLHVTRGAATVQYGNGAGGAINISTKNGETFKGVTLNLDVGSDDLYKLNAQAGTSNNTGSAYISASHLNFNGYREQSQVEKTTLRGKFIWNINDSKTLTVITSLMDMPTSEDPGGLTRTQVNENRRQATFMAKRLDSGQQVEQQTLGLTLRDSSFDNTQWMVNLFATHRDFEQQLPFPGSSLIAYDRWFYGSSFEITQDLRANKRPIRHTSGIEIRKQEDDRQRFSVSPNAEITRQTVDELQEARSMSAFSIVDWHLNDAVILTTGVRYDDLKMSIDAHLAQSGVGSGQRKYREWNGNLGLSYRLGLRHQWYANLATSYESPTFTEFANPQGAGFNPFLKPQDSLSRELGVRGELSNIQYDITLFATKVTDEIIPYEIDGLRFFENAGKTDRKGLELAFEWQLNEQWQWRNALTLARYQFDNFTPLSGDNVNGNRMPGLPRQQWVSQINWQYNKWRIELESSYTGRFYAENSNDTQIKQNWLFNTRASYSLSPSVSIKAGIRNLFSKDYFANVRINANANRDVSQRGYFEPAPERNLYFGLSAKF